MSNKKASSMVMTKGGSVPLSMEVITKDIVCENAKDQPGWARGPGRHGGGVVRPFDKLRAHQPRSPSAVGP